MTKMKRGAMLAALAAATLTAGAAAAQTSEMRLIRDPVYGELRDVLGATLPVATPNPKCSKTLLLPDGACLDQVVSGMKARGATSTLVLTAPGAGGGAGTVISGPIDRAYRLYDVSLTGGPSFRPVTLPTSSVRVPRDCYGAGRGVDYRLDLRDGQLVARELQTVSCGGPVPPIGYGGPRLPPIGANEPGERWPATAVVAVTGAPRQLAAPRPDCPPDAALRDGICFAAGIAVLASQPAFKELDVIGAKRPVAPGVVLVDKETEQYVLKRKGKAGFKADKRWFDKSSLSTPAGCALTSPVDFEVEPGELVHERALAGCGAPPAPAPVAVFEAYGVTMPVVQGNRPGCAERGEQLLGDACFTDVIGWMRARKVPKAEVLVLERPYGPGARVSGGGPIRYSFADIWVNPDGTYKADRKHSYSAQIRSGGCSNVTDGGAEASGLMLVRGDGGVMARAYQWVACPVR
ncbi:hypothetical protein [Caulobacter soli]|uniref:hypothetical protein n=1 Tax=Caulobacter soli TaxID=2708539 RepID=UPI001FE4056F|nr:hypothetical protein [Caulobacter soli]